MIVPELKCGATRGVLLACLILPLSLPALAEAAEIHYYHVDGLGSVVAVTNEAAEVVERREYEPFGLRIDGEAAGGPGYTGHVHDLSTGLDYMQQRYYDARIGRFLSVDPMAVDADSGWNFNRYSYAANSPYTFTDPDGRAIQALWGAPLGAVANIGVQMAVANGTLSQRFSQVSWTQVGVATAAGAISGGVSAIASTAATASGSIAANVIGNAAVGAVASQANAQLEGRTASMSEVLHGAALNGAVSGAGTAISSAPGAIARHASAGMTQSERTATGNLMQGIKDTTPGFTYTSGSQTLANGFGAAVGVSGELKALLEDKKK